jgi:hypothetical protein
MISLYLLIVLLPPFIKTSKKFRKKMRMLSRDRNQLPKKLYSSHQEGLRELTTLRVLALSQLNLKSADLTKMMMAAWELEVL